LTMSKGNAFSFWQNREEATHKSGLTRSSSSASEFLHLRKAKGKNLSSPSTKKEEVIAEEPASRKNLTSNVNSGSQVEEGAKEENGSPVLRRPKKEALPPPTDAAEVEEEEIRKYVRMSIRRIKRETRVFSQEGPSMQSSTIPELDPVEVDEEEVEEMLPLVKDLLAGNQPVPSEDEDEPKPDPEKVPSISVDHADKDPVEDVQVKEEDAADKQRAEPRSDPEKVPSISIDHADEDLVEDVQVEKEDAADKQGAEQNLESLIKELENADDLGPESLKDILKRSLSALKTMSEKMKTLESQLKGEASSSPVSVAPSGPPPPPPPAPPPSLMAGPKPLVIKKRQGNAQAEKIGGPPQVDMMAEMRKMMARRNERKSLRVKYTHLEK